MIDWKGRKFGNAEGAVQGFPTPITKRTKLSPNCVGTPPGPMLKWPCVEMGGPANNGMMCAFSPGRGFKSKSYISDPVSFFQYWRVVPDRPQYFGNLLGLCQSCQVPLSKITCSQKAHLVLFSTCVLQTTRVFNEAGGSRQTVTLAALWHNHCNVNFQI